jgi:hypothetical protein
MTDKAVPVNFPSCHVDLLRADVDLSRIPDDHRPRVAPQVPQAPAGSKTHFVSSQLFRRRIRRRWNRHTPQHGDDGTGQGDGQERVDGIDQRQSERQGREGEGGQCLRLVGVGGR